MWWRRAGVAGILQSITIQIRGDNDETRRKGVGRGLCCAGHWGIDGRLCPGVPEQAAQDGCAVSCRGDHGHHRQAGGAAHERGLRPAGGRGKPRRGRRLDRRRRGGQVRPGRPHPADAQHHLPDGFGRAGAGRAFAVQRGHGFCRRVHCRQRAAGDDRQHGRGCARPQGVCRAGEEGAGDGLQLRLDRAGILHERHGRGAQAGCGDRDDPYSLQGGRAAEAGVARRAAAYGRRPDLLVAGRHQVGQTEGAGDAFGQARPGLAGCTYRARTGLPAARGGWLERDFRSGQDAA